MLHRLIRTSVFHQPSLTVQSRAFAKRFKKGGPVSTADELDNNPSSASVSTAASLQTASSLPSSSPSISSPSIASPSPSSASNPPPRIFQASAAPAKRSALETALKHIELQYGKGTIMQMNQRAAAPPSVQVIPTGSVTLDTALGIGGIPRGRIIEVYGPESSGKTTLALHIVAEAQKRGATCVFIDAEHALDVSYARRVGVNVDQLLVSQPDSGEQALEICETLVRSGGVELVVIDSVAALVPKAEIEGDMGDAHMALQARLMSQALRKLTAHLSKQSTTLLFINQIRHKVGVMFGNPEVTSGGNALKFYASMRMDIRRIAPVKQGETIVGNRVRVKVAKNKLAPPFREAEFDIEFGHGISKAGELVDLGVQYNFLQKAGSWYAYGDKQIAQGKEKVKQFLIENPDVMSQLEAQVRQAAWAVHDQAMSGKTKQATDNAIKETSEESDDIHEVGAADLVPDELQSQNPKL